MDREAAKNMLISYIRWHRQPPVSTGAGDADFVPFQNNGTYGRWRDRYLNWLFGYRDTIKRYLMKYSEREISQVIIVYNQNPMFSGATGGARKAQRIWYGIPLEIRKTLINGATAGDIEFRLDEYIGREFRSRLGQISPEARDFLNRNNAPIDVTIHHPSWWIPVSVYNTVQNPV